MPQEAVLSCESCTRRKIKCDKVLPNCSNCDRFGIKCNPVSRQRLPRGRNGGRKKADDSELRTRLARLESMVKSMEAAGINPNDPSTFAGLPNSTGSGSSGNSAAANHSGSTPVGGLKPPSPPAWSSTGPPSIHGDGTISAHGSPAEDHKHALHRPHLAHNLSERSRKALFWATFENEVAGLREFLEGDDSDEEGDDPMEGALDVVPLNESTMTSNLFMLRPGSFAIDPSVLQQPPDNMVHALCDVYLDRVDRLFKVLHIPTVRRHLQHGEPYLGTMSADTPSVKALRFAIYYAAVNTLEDAECNQLFFQDRGSLMARLCSSTEIALAQADVACARDLETLQAFAIYLIAVRLNDSRPTTWSLVALAIRLARGMGMHEEAHLSRFNTFHAEMRRRLWWNLCILDAMTSKDRGSEPIFVTSCCDTLAPKLINDDDMPTPDFNGVLNDRESFTDMTHWSLSRDTVYLSVKMNKEWKDDDNWHKRHQMLLEYEQAIKHRFLRHCDMSVPIQGLTVWTASAIMANIFLIAFKPIEEQVIQRPKGSGPSLLAAAINVLEKGTAIPPVFKRWSWWAWIQWHGLAVALSELCNIPDGPLADKCWPVVEGAFQYYSTLIGDARAVVMWRPVEKLHARAAKKRKAQLDMKHAMTHSPPEMHDVNAFFPPPMPDPSRSPHSIQQQWSEQAGRIFDFTVENNPSAAFDDAQTWLSMFPGHSQPGREYASPGPGTEATASPPDDNWMQFVTEYMDASSNTNPLASGSGFDSNGIVF